MTKTPILALFLMLSAGLALAASGPTGLDKLKAYEGNWKITIEHLDTPYSKAGKETTSLRNECWRNGGFFACNQYVDGESKALIVFTYSAKDELYHSYPIPTDGGDASSGKLTIKDNVWTFPWEDTRDGKHLYFQVVNTFTAPGTIEYRQEFSEDKIHWTITAKGIEHKAP